MKLTPLDIHHKEFHRAMRGYSEAEVDVFLDQVADEFERLFKENLDHKEQVEKMSEKVQQYEGLEKTLQKALFTAQQTADEMQDKARKESELIITDAEAKAKGVIQDAINQKQDLHKDIENLRKAEKEFRSKFRELLGSYIEVIDKIEKGEMVAGEEPVAPPKAAEKIEEPPSDVAAPVAEKEAVPEQPNVAEVQATEIAKEEVVAPAVTSPRVTIGEPKPEVGAEQAAPEAPSGAEAEAVKEGKTDEFDFFGETGFLDKGPRDFGVPGRRDRAATPGWQATPAPVPGFEPPAVPEARKAVQEAPAEEEVDAARKVSNFFDEDLGADDADKEGKSDLDSGELS